MIRHALSSTQRQVAAVLAVSLILSHALVILSVIALFHERTPRVPPGTAAALQIVGRLYAALPGSRAAILDAARRAGLPAVAADAAFRARCNVADDAPPTPGPPIACPAKAGQPPGAIVPAGDVWLRAAASAGHIQPPPPARHPWQVFYGLTVVIGLPTLVLSLWGSRRVTAPLNRLAAAAEAMQPDGPVGTLPVSGTAEIRLLAGSFNRLILRLQAFGAEQRRIVAAVSHDLRTPLTRIRLRLEAVDDGPLREKLVRDVDTMQMIADSSLSLIRAQESRFQTVPVDLSALLQTAVDGFSDTGASIEYEGPHHLIIACDPAMVTRAVENLIDNALKFGGVAAVRLASDPGTATIDVLDHGPGIPDAEKARVLEPYYRSDTARTAVDGTGLGLSIARSIAEGHGGTLTLHDHVPSGLHVRMTLPLA